MKRPALKVTDVLVLIDRQGGGREQLAEAGYTLHSVLTLDEIAAALKASGHISPDDYQRVKDFIS